MEIALLCLIIGMLFAVAVNRGINLDMLFAKKFIDIDKDWNKLTSLKPKVTHGSQNTQIDYSKMTYQELYSEYVNHYDQIKEINKAMNVIERNIPFCSKCADRASAKYNGKV